jgi:hypothetical protein
VSIPRLLALIALIAVVALAGAIVPAPVAGQDGGSPLIHYHGLAQQGGEPYPAGKPVAVVVTPTATSFVICGLGRITGADGAYAVDVERKEPCGVRRPDGSRLTYYFLIDGEQVHNDGGMPFLDAPTQTRRVPLIGHAPIPGFVALDAIAPPMIRFYGRAFIGGGREVPAPPGTEVRVDTGVRPEERHFCASGAVGPSDGWYWVDIPRTETCSSPRQGQARDYFFAMLGEPATSHPGSAPRLGAPGAIGRLHLFNVVIAAPWPGRVIVEGDAPFVAQIAACFHRYQAAANRREPLAAVMSEVLTFLETNDDRAGATAVTIRPDAALNEAFGRTGRAAPAPNPRTPSSAITRLDPANAGGSGNSWWDHLVASTAQFGEGVAQALGAAPASPDLCDILIHELDHATAFMTGQEDGGAGICQLANGALEEREVSAMALTNVYRNLSGREPIWGYPGPVDFFGTEIEGFVRLPERAIHPTPADFGLGGPGRACP